MQRLPTILSRNMAFFSQVRMSGEPGSGSGKGGGGGGTIRDAGGAFGKMEAAREDQYFYNLQKEQLSKLRDGLHDEISFHEEQIKRHQEAISRHKKRIGEMEKKLPNPNQGLVVLSDHFGSERKIEQLEVWKIVLKLQEKDLTSATRVCSLHFEKDDYVSLPGLINIRHTLKKKDIQKKRIMFRFGFATQIRGIKGNRQSWFRKINGP